MCRPSCSAAAISTASWCGRAPCCRSRIARLRPSAASRRTGVFVAYFSYGSPATRYQLWAGRRIVEVDGQPIADLDAFIKAVAGREDRSSLRLRTVSWNGSVEVITLKLDKRYWPTYELRRTDAVGWQRWIALQAVGCKL